MLPGGVESDFLGLGLSGFVVFGLERGCYVYQRVCGLGKVLKDYPMVHLLWDP